MNVKFLTAIVFTSFALIPSFSYAFDRQPEVLINKAASEFMPNSTIDVYHSEYNGIKDDYHKNNSRKNVLIIGEKARSDDLTLIVWFHGLGGFSEKTFKRVLSQVGALDKRNTPIAVLIPEMPWSTNTQTPRSRQGRVWKNQNSFVNYLNEAHSKLKNWASSHTQSTLGPLKVIIVGHSAGGSAIMSASVEGSLCDKRVHAVVWSDASYGSWLKRANSGCLKNSTILQKVLVRKWDDPYNRAVDFYKKNRGPFHELKVLSRRKYTHGGIGDNALDLSNLFPPGC